jgi:predicted permease
MIRDLKHAVRVLLRSKGWTAIVLLSLALGIGANTALFTAVNGLLLQTVPVPDPESLVRLKWSGQNDMNRNTSDYGYSREVNGQGVRSSFSYSIYKELRAANQTMTDLLACAPAGSVNVIVDGSADLASALGVTGNYFQLLRVPAKAGRLLNEADAEPSAQPAAVISEAFWHRRFAGDANTVGRVVTMNNVQVTIVGVAPASFTGIQRLGAAAPDVTIPLTQINQGPQQLAQPTTWWLQIVGRRKPGVSDEQIRGNFEGVFHATARAGLASHMNSLSEKDRNLSTNRQEGHNVPRLLVSSGSQGIYDLDNAARRSASILGVVVVLVLLIVCANVANLLLSRATSRRKEITVRLSMGATRARLLRQLLTESLLLSGLGGMLGLVVGYWSRQLLPFGQTVPLDWRVFAFVGGVSVLTGVAFGLVPAFRATRVDLAGTMKEHSRGVVGSRTILSRALLVAQVAISLVLLIGASLFLRTLGNLRGVDVGFDPSNLLVFRVNPQLNRYDAERTAQIYKQLEEGLEVLPGVRSVTLSRTLPLSGSTSSSTTHVRGGATNNNTYQMTVSSSYFETMNIPILRGRVFNEHDVKGAPRVAVLNETAARKLFPDGDALGGRVGYSLETSGDIEVVGVVRDTKYSSLRDVPPPTMFSHYVQTGAAQMAVVLRTAGDPNAMVDAARGVLRQVDSTLPMTNITTQMAQLEGRFAQERLFATAYALFGGLALLLASIGLFGVMSYTVSRRTNEIGVRMALGARRVDVIRMVLGESSVMVLLGVVTGLAIAGVTVKLAWNQLTGVLFGLPPTDVTAVAVAVVLMAIVATIAGFVPARRASKVDPLAALRVE